MRKFVSRVDDVFQIEGRGCIVLPGIPRDPEWKIKIGDQLWLERPDHSEISTLIRGVDIFTGNQSSGIPILLASELSKDQVPVGTILTIEFTPSETVTLHAKSESGTIAPDRVFKQDELGHLKFGRQGKSRRAATAVDIQNKPIEFTDYVMEGFVKYHLSLMATADQLTLNLFLHGTKRDQYLPTHAMFQLVQNGLRSADEGNVRRD